MTAPLRTASIRRRLILWTMAVLVVVLGVTVVATDLLLGSQLRSAATSQLTNRTQKAQEILDGGAQPAEVLLAAQGEGISAQLVTTDGRVYGDLALTAGPPVPPAEPPAAPENGPTPKPKPPPPVNTEPADPQTRTVYLSDGSTLTVAVDTASITQVRNQLRTILIPIVIAALLIAAALVVFTVRRALKPLDAMTALARSIAHGNRGERLNPDRTDTELGRTAVAFDGMLDSLETAEKREHAAAVRNRQFFDDAAHELRTPIAGVQAASESLVRTGADVDPATREQLELLVVRETRRAAHLVDELLSLARIDEGLELDRHQVDLLDLVNADAERVRVQAPSRQITVDGTHAVAGVDPVRIGQVVANLTDNACQYSTGPIDISVEEGEHSATVRVTDHGIGVPAEDRDRIFGRLVRLDQARTANQGGSGLGLAIARDLARAHGGDLVCTGNDNSTTFELTLPKARTSLGAPLARARHRDRPACSSTTPGEPSDDSTPGVRDYG